MRKFVDKLKAKFSISDLFSNYFIFFKNYNYNVIKGMIALF